MKILVILFRTLGDICMGTTVVRAIKQKFPDSDVDFVTEDASVNILEGNPDISNIFIANNYYEALSKYGVNGYDKIYKLNMANHLDTCWHHVPKHKNQHLVEWYAKRAEIDTLDDKNIYIYPSEKDVEKVEHFSRDLPENLIAIHTSSGWHGSMNINSKDWPIYYFDVIAERLIKNGYNVIQIGGKSDKPLTTEGVINGLGAMSFKQTFLLLKSCSGFIGVDSGPAYLAGQSGIPSMVIMGATQNQTEFNSGPSVGPRNDNVYYINPERPNDSNCTPTPCYVNCIIKKQGGCISDILPNIIWDSVTKNFSKAS